MTSTATWQSCSHYRPVHLSRTTGDNIALNKNYQHISIDNYIQRGGAKSQYWNNMLTNCFQWNTLMQHTTLHSVLQVFRIQHTNNTPSSKVYGTAPWFRQTVAVSHHKNLGLIPDQYMWDLQWTKWHCNRFFSTYFSFPSNHGVLKSLQVNSGIVPSNLDTTATFHIISKSLFTDLLTIIYYKEEFPLTAHTSIENPGFTFAT